MKFKIIFLTFFAIISSNIIAQNIYSDFPSGNITIDKIRNDTVWMRPDLRDTQGDWFYWCFAVNKAKGKNLTFAFTKPDVFTVKGPAVSYDSGNNWEWLGTGNILDQCFSYTFKTDDEVRFSMSMPYTQKQFDTFIQPYLKIENVKLDILTSTKAGRKVERIIIKPINASPKYKVLITARHHACEMMANYNLEGIIREILKDKWLLNNVEFCMVPFMDKDGVENGDQGKNRNPHDHNRDYSGKSIYASTASLRNWVPGWAENKLVVCFDLHCPWIRGENNENIYMVGIENPKIAEQQRLFCKLLKNNNNGELKLSDKLYLPFGTSWNTGKNYSQGFSYSQWASKLEGVSLTCSIEFPYGNNEGQTMSQENARVFGEDIARALKAYLMQL